MIRLSGGGNLTSREPILTLRKSGDFSVTFLLVFLLLGLSVGRGGGDGTNNRSSDCAVIKCP